ncbi:SOS response-associated peptidase [Halomonas denitrificans]|uniref:SOS response-associated peptidase n=1 Tax=Halomonas TaxID=2745 RepID=UPI001A8FA33C|nr:MULTISPECIES: SOS response-associated peptidase [Halomonas]MEE3214853.1 SOS response-associated peptidase [Pseudomonadota bacterium]MBN8411908.1 SOS response-associated peptidase [Halomonas litopenaei]MBY5926472.1 SOS response-associated peptidase [Halomonas sp. DP4Y7-2]MBY5930113.1 SOS response-associated peptidase [Halomonas sp. DP8Y7-3]MBY5985540.1 SOS response-associated peptidase [Halomonas sp. DP5Y7-2]
MTGRLYIPARAIEHALDDLDAPVQAISGVNMAPRRPLSIIRLEAGRFTLGTGFWGLTPPWLKVLDHAPHCARAESLESRPMFRDAFRARRCLVPASGAYAWQPRPHYKQPFLITRADRGPLLLAGLWCRFHTTLTDYTDSFALITVPSPELLTPLTDRVPAIIERHQARAWLDPASDSEPLEQMLRTPPGELLGAFPVSRRVNNPLEQDPSCAHPIGQMWRQTL